MSLDVSRSRAAALFVVTFIGAQFTCPPQAQTSHYDYDHKIILEQTETNLLKRSNTAKVETRTLTMSTETNEPNSMRRKGSYLQFYLAAFSAVVIYFYDVVLERTTNFNQEHEPYDPSTFLPSEEQLTKARRLNIENRVSKREDGIIAFCSLS